MTGSNPLASIGGSSDNAKRIAALAPATSLLLAASTEMAMPYGAPNGGGGGGGGGNPGLGNPGNNKPVGNAGEFPPGQGPGGTGDRGNSR
jgi:hypothetical protein